MKWFVTYGRYQKLSEELYNEKSRTASLKYENMRLTQQWIDAESDSKKWREAYETLLHTPEYKADVESAFQRGVAHTNAQFRAWLQHLAFTYGMEKKDE